MNRVNVQHIPYHPPIKPLVKQNTDQVSKQSFMDHLKQATGEELKISKHASERLNERNISITDREWQQISEKVFEAKNKGVKQPLVLLDQAALIVSAKMRRLLRHWIEMKQNSNSLPILMEQSFYRPDLQK